MSTPMTTKERMIRTIHHQEADRILMVDSAWAGTQKRWYQEGLPEGVSWEDYFGYDHVPRLFTNNSPRHPSKVLEETDRYIIVVNEWGQTIKNFKELDSTPQVLDCYYNTPERWQEAKARMLQFDDSRIPWDNLKKNYPMWKKRGDYLQLVIWFGFDVTHSRMIGTEDTLIAMYEDPDWLRDVFDTYLTLSLDYAQKVLDAGYEFDGIFFYDDMGYKGTSFFSPEMYREILKPYHKRAVDWAHERGLSAELHSCGFIEKLLPDLVDVGIDILNPMEIKAGMNPVLLKELYGDKLAFHGGINAQLWDKIDLVEAEMRRIIPLMKEHGGYIFASDHSIPNSVSFENMTRISALAHELGKYN